MGLSISGIVNFGKTVCKYGKRVVGATPELIFGTSAEAAGKAMRATKLGGGSVFQAAEAGWKAIEAGGKGSFFKSFLGNIKSFLPDMGKAIKAGSTAAKAAGKSSIAGGVKGLFKGIGQKLPFIGAAAMMLFEVPNIVKATKEQGLVSGVKETVKSGARLAGGGLGAAIGSAICPGIGSLVGWIAGEWLAGKVVGRSYTEQQAEKEQQVAEIQQQIQQGQLVNPQGQIVTPQPQVPGQVQYPTNPFTFGGMTNPYYLNPIPYSDDIMMQQLPFNVVG